jgi:alpha-L-fucosidase
VCPALSDFGLFLEPEFEAWLPPVGTDPKVLAAARAKAKWKVTSVSYEAEGNGARRAIDGNPGTIWHTHVPGAERGFPQEFAVDMGEEKTLKGFTYLPRQDGTMHGMVDQYAFAVSLDGQAWTTAAEGEFGNLRANPVEQTVAFAPVAARHFKFVARHALEKEHAVVAEIGVVEQ